MITEAQRNDPAAVQAEVAKWFNDHKHEFLVDAKCGDHTQKEYCRKHQEYLRQQFSDGTLRPEFALCSKCKHFHRRDTEEDKAWGIGRQLTAAGRKANRKNVARQLAERKAARAANPRLT